MILSKAFNDELQKYTTLDLLRMLKEYEDYNDSCVCDDGGIPSSPFSKTGFFVFQLADVSFRNDILTFKVCSDNYYHSFN